MERTPAAHPQEGERTGEVSPGACAVRGRWESWPSCLPRNDRTAAIISEAAFTRAGPATRGDRRSGSARSDKRLHHPRANGKEQERGDQLGQLRPDRHFLKHRSRLGGMVFFLRAVPPGSVGRPTGSRPAGVSSTARIPGRSRDRFPLPWSPPRGSGKIPTCVELLVRPDGLLPRIRPGRPDSQKALRTGSLRKTADSIPSDSIRRTSPVKNFRPKAVHLHVPKDQRPRANRTSPEQLPDGGDKRRCRFPTPGELRWRPDRIRSAMRCFRNEEEDNGDMTFHQSSEATRRSLNLDRLLSRTRNRELNGSVAVRRVTDSSRFVILA